MRQPTIVSQPPTSLIIPDNVSTSDPEHKLARVLHASTQPKPTFSLLHSTTHKLSEFTYSSSPVDREDEPLFATIDESLIDSRDKRYRSDDLDDEPLFATDWSAFGASLKVYEFSSAYLANLNRRHIIADHHGCTHSDVALSERTKPFPHPKAHLLSPEQRSGWCAQWKQQREEQHEQQRLACEIEWRRELATWPAFVPRNPINTPQLVLRDLTTLNTAPSLKPFIGDYLAEVNPGTCTHLNLRSFAFNTGETIRSCPDCTTFDKQRIATLKTGSIPRAQMLPWEERLEAEGLFPIALLPRKQTKKDLEAIEHAQAAEGKASPARADYRASQIGRDVKTNTEATRNCLGCGQPFVPTRKGHEKYCSLNCNKRHNKQMKRRRNGDSHV